MPVMYVYIIYVYMNISFVHVYIFECILYSPGASPTHFASSKTKQKQKPMARARRLPCLRNMYAYDKYVNIPFVYTYIDQHQWYSHRASAKQFAHKYIYMHVYIHKNIYIHEYVCVYMYMHIHICVCIRMYVYICIRIFLCVCICVWIYTDKKIISRIL